MSSAQRKHADTPRFGKRRVRCADRATSGIRTMGDHEKEEGGRDVVDRGWRCLSCDFVFWHPTAGRCPKCGYTVFVERSGRAKGTWRDALLTALRLGFLPLIYFGGCIGDLWVENIPGSGSLLPLPGSRGQARLLIVIGYGPGCALGTVLSVIGYCCDNGKKRFLVPLSVYVLGLIGGALLFPRCLEF